MNNLDVIRVFDKEELVQILNTHKKYLYTLKNNIIDIDEYSSKALRFGLVYAAYFEEQLAGFCIFYANDNVGFTGFLSMIAVQEKYRNMKIGKLLLEVAVDVCKENDMKYLKLSVRKENNSAIGFYQRNKFSFIDTNNEDSFMMIRTLS